MYIAAAPCSVSHLRATMDSDLAIITLIGSLILVLLIALLIIVIRQQGQNNNGSGNYTMPFFVQPQQAMAPGYAMLSNGPGGWQTVPPQWQQQPMFPQPAGTVSAGTTPGAPPGRRTTYGT